MSNVLSPELATAWIVQTTSKNINNFLGDGFVRGTVYTIYSRQDRGKSNLCLELAFQAGKMGFKVAYIDGDAHGVTVHRLYKIIKARYPNAKILEPTQVPPSNVYDYYKKRLAKYNIDIFWENTLTELKNKCLEIAQLNQHTVIIVDSVSLFYGEYVTAGGPSEKKDGTTDITTIYGKLRTSAINSNHLKILVLTTQRASDVKEAMRINVIEKKQQIGIQIDSSDKEEIDRHMGGKTPGYFSDVIIQLTKFGKIRKAEYIKNRLSGSDIIAEFKINDAGIEDK